jgi:hypothetical protein
MEKKSGLTSEKMIDKIRLAVNDPAKEIERLVGNALNEEFYRLNSNIFEFIRLLLRFNTDRALRRNRDPRQKTEFP